MTRRNTLINPWRQTSRWLTTGLTTAAIALSSAMHAQVNGYSFAQTSGTYSPLVGGTVVATPTGNALATSVDNAVFEITGFPFTFSYNGVGYTSCYMSSNGFISFGATAPGAATYTAISTAGTDGIVAAWAGDLNGMFQVNGITSDMRWDVVGTAPNREVVLQWTDWRPSYTTSITSAYRINMQIRLQETTNNVVISYGPGAIVVGTGTYSGTRQIGLRGTTNADYNNRLNAASVLFTASTNGTANTSTQAWNTTGTPPPGMPSNGQTYTWAPPACPAPGGVNVNGITASAATVNYTCTACSGTYVVEYGIAPFNTPGSGATAGAGGTAISVPASTFSQALSGLASTTAYDVYVRRDCGGAGYSNNTTKATFTTACVASTAPFNENFDSGVATFTPPTCWSNPLASGGEQWRSATTPLNGNNPTGVLDHTGNGGKIMWLDASSDILPNELISPLIDMSTLSSRTVGFWFLANNTNTTVPVVQHGISLDVWDGAAWLNLVTYYGNDPNWIKLSAVVPGSVPTTTTFRIVGLRDPANVGSGTYFYKDLFVDDFFVIETPSCPSPNALTATGETSLGADLGWTESGTATVWDLEIGTAGFIPTGTPTNNDVTANPYTWAGGTSATDYAFYVRADCGMDNVDVSAWAGPFSFTTLCTEFVAPFTEGFDVPSATVPPNCWSTSLGAGSGWEFNGPNGTDFNTACGAPGNGATGTGSFAWVDYSTPTDVNVVLNAPIVDVSALTTPQLRFSRYMCATTNAPNPLYVEYYDGAAWQILASYTTATATTGTGAAGWQEESVVLTPAIISGEVQIRFRAEDGGGPNSFNGDMGLDEIYFEEAPTCLTPTGATATNVTTVSADISWTCVSCIGNYIVEYGVQGFTPGSGPTAGAGGTIWTGGAVAGSPVTITGLSAQTSYSVYVREECSGIDYSTNSNAASFTTPCASLVPDQSEDFSTFLPACWDVANNGDAITGPTEIGTSPWLSSTLLGTSARINLYTTSRSDWLLTPNYDLSGGGYEVVIDVAVTNWNSAAADAMGSDDVVTLLMSEDGITWTSLGSWTAADALPNSPTAFTYPLASSGSAVRFGILATDGPIDDAQDYDFHVTNFMVRTPPTCDATAVPVNEDCIAGTYDIEITDVSVTGPGTVQYTLNNGAVQSVPFISPTTTIAGLDVTQAAIITLVTDAGCTNEIGNVQSACAVELDCNATSPLPFEHCYSNGDTRKWYFHTPEVGGSIDLKFLAGSELGAGDNVIFWNGVPGASAQIGSYSGDMSNLTFTGQTNQYLGMSITTNGSGSCEDGLDGTVWNFTVRCSGCIEPTGLVLLPPDNGTAVDCINGTYEASVYVGSFGIDVNTGTPPATTTISYTAGGVPQDDIVLNQTSDESGVLTSLGSWPLGVELDVTLLHGGVAQTLCDNNIGTAVTMPYSACPPINDDCATPTVLTVEDPADCPANQVVGTTLGADLTGTAPPCGGGPVQDVWYSVNTTGFADGTLTVTPVTASTIGAQFFSECGTPVGACISPVSVVNFNLPPGPYLIRFFTTEANAGTFNVCMSAPPPAANDEPCTATPLALGIGDCVMTATSNVNATNSTNAGIPAPGCSSFAGGDIWFTTVVGPSGIVTFDSEAGTVTDIGMVVYTSATDCNGPFTLVECDDDDSANGLMSRIVLTGRTPGEVLYVRVFEYGNNAIGTFSICASEPPLNNDCAGAISLDPSTLACTGENGTTANATQSLAGCTGTANDDVWYSFVATETSHVIRVSGVGTFNPVLQLIDGGVAPDCNALGASIVCQNASGAGGLEEFTAVGLSIGNTYFVRVYDSGTTNFLAGTTSFNICVTKVPTCLAPTATAASGITTGSANANWTPNVGGSGTDFIVEYGPSATFTTPGTGLTAGPNGTVILGATTPQLISGLNDNTEYRYFVRQNCTGTAEGFSFNSNGITFTTLALPPANDECAGAVLLSGSNTTCINTLGTIAGSTRSLPAPDCSGTADDDVWYKFVAEGAGNYTINVNGTPGTLDGAHQLFSGTSCGALTQVACSDPAAMTVQGLTAGQTYYIRVYSWSSVQPANKTFNICVVKNSDCLPPTTITTSNLTSTSADVNVEGSLSANYILEYGLQSNFTTPGVDGNPGTNGTVIAFTGNLQQIAGLTALTGYRYFIRRDCGTGVYSSNSTVRTFTTLGPPPANDLCANAVTVTCGNTYSGTNVNATADGVPSQAAGGEATVDNGVWWKYIGNNQTVTLDICASGFDTRIHVYEGACGTLVGVSGNDDFCGTRSTVSFGAASGTTYFIAVEGYGTASGAISMIVSCGPYCAPPSNNACANAQLITPSPIGFCNPVTGTTACATSTAGPNPTCAGSTFQTYQDVYYTFTAAGSAHPIQVNVLSGTLSFWALYEATCGGQQDFCSNIYGSQVSVTGLTPGAVYKIRVGSQVDADFDICIGAPTCEQDLAVEWQLGATGAIPAWEMRQVGTDLVVASGGGFNPGVPFAVYPEVTCLPAGNFYFAMLSPVDAGGGYKIRLSQAPFTRFIDNTVSVGSGSINEVSGVPAALGSNGPLQIPVGSNDLLYSSCDKYFWAAGEYLVANQDAQVAATWLVGQGDAAQSSTSGYDFWFYNPDGGYSFIRQRRNNVSDNFAAIGSARTCHMKVNNWAAANHIPNLVELNVRVRAVVNNVPKNWGPACRFTRNEALANCTPTKLFDIPGHFAYSCGVIRAFNTATANRLYARPVAGATKYRFHIFNGETDITLERTVYYLTLGWNATVAPPLQDEAVYDVTVEAFVGGQYCPVGEVCSVQICNTPASCTNDLAGGQQNSLLDTEGAFLMWPNPNNGAQLNVTLSGVAEDMNTVSLDIFDLSGKRIITRTLGVQDGFVNQVVDLNGEISTGMYMVKVTAGDQVYTERLVIQK